MINIYILIITENLCVLICPENLYNLISYIETDFKKCYNVNMSIGMSSAYSVYSGQINSVYSTPATSIKNKQDSSDGELSTSSSNDEINDEAIISDEAMNLYNKDKAQETTTLPGEKKSQSDNVPGALNKELTPEQQQQVEKLKEADAEVKAHEQAHIAAAAGLRTSSPSYQYETGPDGKKYAVSGEVSVSFSQTGDPQKDMIMAEALKSAALAPANPSGQDMAVAKQAEEMIQEDKQKIQENQPQTDTTQKADNSDPTETKETKPDNINSISDTTTSVQNDSEPIDVLRVQDNRAPVTVM